MRGAPILLLDKPARRVDAVTLQAVWNSLAELGERRTVLLAPHRLEGLWAMDEILVLEQGRIVARGRHAELLVLGGAYSRMWEAERDCIRSAYAVEALGRPWSCGLKLDTIQYGVELNGNYRPEGGTVVRGGPGMP